MQYRTLGRTGIKVSPDALGALALGTSIGNLSTRPGIGIVCGARDQGLTQEFIFFR